MKRTIPFILIVGLLIYFVFSEANRSSRVNFDANFSREYASPLGTKLVYEALGDLFPSAVISPVSESPNRLFDGKYPTGTNYIIIDEYFKPDQWETHTLLDYVRTGNNLFLSIHDPVKVFFDSLNAAAGKQYVDDFWWYNPDKYPRMFVEEDHWESVVLQGDDLDYPLEPGRYYSHFNQVPEGAEILGIGDDRNPNFVRLSLGKGNLYLHSVPYVFTNYFMVDGITDAYISGALSHLPVQKTYWDEFYKPVRSRASLAAEFVLHQPSLRWAWFVLAGTLLIFVFFGGKRKVAVAEYIPPPENNSLDFAKSMGQLYYQHRDHFDLGKKKTIFLLEHIRSKYNLNVLKRDEKFQRQLAARSGVPEAKIKALFDHIEKFRKNKTLTETGLITLSRQIDEFYRQSK